MSKFLITTAAALAITSGAATAVTIDFNADATGFYGPNDGSQDYGDIYRGTGINGLIFDTPILVKTNGNGTGPTMSGNVAQQATPPFGGDPKGGSFGGTFDGFTVSSLSILAGDSGGDLDLFQLLGFDIDGNLIADTGDIDSFEALTVSINAAGIARFELTIGDMPDNDGSSFFDNIMFDVEPVAAVPLPATLPLVGFGLIALGAATRRRKS